MSESAAISIENLSKSYREGFWLKKKKAIEGITFKVPRGQIFGFLGANGAGKTTTIKIALGLQSADEGKVLVMGYPPDDIRSKQRVGYLPERPYFQDNLTADEFLDFHRGLHVVSKGGSRSNEELFRLVGLAGIGPHLLRGFSKGMLQRIGIAQSLVNDPDLVILDEPMSGLDPVGRKEMRNMILSLNQQGKTIFFSSHILSDIEALCQQIAFVEKGALKYSGRVDDLLKMSEQEYEIIFRMPKNPLPQNLLGRGELQAVGDSYRVLIKGGDNIRELVEAYWSHGAEIISFGRVQKSLEEALFGRGLP